MIGAAAQGHPQRLQLAILTLEEQSKPTREGWCRPRELPGRPARGAGGGALWRRMANRPKPIDFSLTFSNPRPDHASWS